jgi:undecaprenyl-diphosphatase
MNVTCALLHCAYARDNGWISNVIVAIARHFLHHRFPRQFSFVEARLSPGGVFGLYLTLGAAVLIGATWLFGGISEDLITGDPLVEVDAFVSEWFRSNADRQITIVMQDATALASPAAVGILCVLTGGVLLRQRLWYSLLALLLSVAGGVLLNVVLKHLFGRARPGWADPLLALTDPGFPSGHTMVATIIYGFIAVFLVPRIASWRWRAFTAIVTVAIVLVVALSRMYLGAHYLSDVLAAMAAGTAWLALCVTAVETLRRSRGSMLSGSRR